MVTGERKYIPIVDDYIDRDHILIMKDDSIVLNFKNSTFYLKSSYYQKSKIGYVEFLDGKIIFTDYNTSNRISIKIPYFIEEGDVIQIDEFNRYITSLDSTSEEFVNISINKKIKEVKQKKSSNKEKYILDKKLLIIGDIQLRNSYLNIFNPLGYETKVISGFDSYNKVYQEANKADLIVVTEGFIDHNIMWSLKKNYSNLYFVKNKGASYIANQIKNQAVSRKQVCLNS